jgi:hypothetical protein
MLEFCTAAGKRGGDGSPHTHTRTHPLTRENPTLTHTQEPTQTHTQLEKHTHAHNSHTINTLPQALRGQLNTVWCMLPDILHQVYTEFESPRLCGGGVAAVSSLNDVPVGVAVAVSAAKSIAA